MDGIRLSLILPGRSSGELLSVAGWADHWNLAGLWVGDPRGLAANSDDSYVTTTAAALATATETLRLGVVLTLRSSGAPERIAEDIGVVDQMSGGRLELALVPSDGDRDEWTRDATNLLRSWNEWPLPDGDSVPITPQPVQPVIPRLVVGDEGLEEKLHAGRMTFAGERGAQGGAGELGVRRRTVLAVEAPLEGGVLGWLAVDPPGRVRELRALAGDAGAGEIALVLGEGHDCSEGDIKALGTVVVPCLRAYARHADTIVADAWRWLSEKADLHEPPGAASE